MVSHQCLSITLQAEKQKSDGNFKRNTHRDSSSTLYQRGETSYTELERHGLLVDRTYLELFHLNEFWQ